MKNELQIKNLMTPLPHSVGADQNVAVAKALLKKYQVRHLPVLEGGELVGIVSERDIQFALNWAGSDEKELVIKDVLTPDPYIVEPNEKLVEVAERMADGKYGCVLVVENGTLVGIFTTVDACRALTLLLKGDLAGGGRV